MQMSITIRRDNQTIKQKILKASQMRTIKISILKKMKSRKTVRYSLRLRGEGGNRMKSYELTFEGAVS